MRFFPALFGALLITVLVFLFMQSLIQRGKEEGVQLAVHTDVQILRQEQEEEEPEEPEDSPEEPVEEPLLDSMEVLDIAPVTPEPATELELPAMDLALGDIKIQATGNKWSAPLGTGGVGVGGGGANPQGYIEVIPFNTRRPNVPEVAWQNKINGWVLVTFSVTPQGKTRGIRVLDANPRGVFEEKVVAAVEDWSYRIGFSSEMKGDVLLTQRVDVRWENYPQNMPNVD